MAKRFGGSHTRAKLDVLENYLARFATALKDRFVTIYFDAFAGAGAIEHSDDLPLLDRIGDYHDFTEGSARRALGLRHPFARYVFVEQRRDNVAALRNLKNEFASLAERIDIRRGDANRKISEFCEVTDWNESRCVMFLDPFGNQVEWRTLEIIARTRRVDVWYLFPAGLGVHRQISKEGMVGDDHAASLDKIIGDPGWREAFVSVTPVDDLFGTVEERTKIADAEAATRFMAERMKTIFAGVFDEWLPLGRNRAHHYSLMFAWGNPSSKAGELARKFARDVLKK